MKILVIGGSRGIGKDIVYGLSDSHHVSFTSSKGGDYVKNIQSRKLELSSMSDIENFAEQMQDYDGIIFSAAINERKDFLDMTVESYDRIMNINLKSYVFLVQEIEKQEKIKPNMRLIFISSVSSQYYGPKTLHYMLSKVGINGFVKFLAQRYSSKNIMVNAIAPGLIYTEQTRDEFESGAANSLINRTLLKRPGTTDDVVSTINFLLDEKNNYFTGQIISMSGGAIL